MPTSQPAAPDDGWGGPLAAGRRRRSCPRRGTVHRDFERQAHLSHPIVTEPAQPLDQHGDRDALDGVHIDSRPLRDRVVTWFENDLAGQSTHRRCTWGDEHSTKPGYSGVPRQHNHWTATDLRWLTPPDLTPGGKGRHDAAAASRKDARSPHASGSLSGCSSYAAYEASISAARCRARRALRASSTSAASVIPPRTRRASSSRSSSTVVLTRTLAMA
jgi:hypothetical protein